jgi:hypothetical protein
MKDDVAAWNQYRRPTAPLGVEFVPGPESEGGCNICGRLSLRDNHGDRPAEPKASWGSSCQPDNNRLPLYAS